MLNSINRLIGLVYNALPAHVQNEIAIWTTITLAAVNVVQESALPLPPWAHTALLALSVLAGAISVRASVKPLSKQ